MKLATSCRIAVLPNGYNVLLMFYVLREETESLVTELVMPLTSVAVLAEDLAQLKRQ
jgi:hypothetical protein